MKMGYKTIFTEQQRQNDRELRKAGRDLDRDKAALEREEKKLVSISLVKSDCICLIVHNHYLWGFLQKEQESSALFYHCFNRTNI